MEKDHVGKFGDVKVQQNSACALSSISHRGIAPGYEFAYDAFAGEVVVVYVLDTGI